MNNNVILIGRLIDTPIIDYVGVDKDKKHTRITIAVGRNYKGVNGEYETDFIDVEIYGLVAETTCEYCRKGDVIGVRGRLETIIYTDENENKHKKMIVVADKITFLSSKKEEN